MATPTASAAGARMLRPVPGWIECHDCGLVQRLPDHRPGHVVRCCRCHHRLRRSQRRDPLAAATACTVAAALLYLVAITRPLMTLDLRGRENTVSLMSGPFNLLHDGSGLPTVGAVVLFATVLMPGLVIATNLTLFLGARRDPVSAVVPFLLRLQQKLRPWSMVEVYMLGVFVAWSKLISLAFVELDAAIYALAAIMLLMIAADGAFDPGPVWARVPLGRTPVGDPLPAPPARDDQVLGCHGCELVLVAPAPIPAGDERPHALGPCPRCGTALRRRKPNSLARTVAFLASAAVLYLPANVLPVLQLSELGRGQPSTIIAGVEELYASGMLPLALLVFFASITVPCLKVASLALMACMTRYGSAWLLLDRTRLFRVVDFIGRWSMIDVFMTSILVAVVQFGFLATVRAEPGIVAFAAVVVLTIFAANSFDPRLMWDAAGRAREARRAPGPVRPDPSPLADAA